MDILMKFKNHLEEGKNARTLKISTEEREHVADLYLLTEKPVIYVANVDEEAVTAGNQFVHDLKAQVSHENAEVLMVCGALESQIAELEGEEERELFLEEYGLKESGLNQLIETSYRTLRLDHLFYGWS